MKIHDNKNLRRARRKLRNNPTSEEALVWEKIKNSALGFKFRRQHSIGNFIVDFYCSEKKLIIEIDGLYHLDEVEYDEERTKYLNSLGFMVIRFQNAEVNSNLKNVIEKIKSYLQIGYK